LLNVGGNLLLIPTLGIEGAAIATLLSKAVLASLFVRELRSVVGAPRCARRAWIAVVGSAAFSVVLWWLPPLPLPMTIALGAIVYAASLLCFADVRRFELQVLLGWWRSTRSGSS
jgi:O-antigen/teichoic acid export membrane protein